MALAQSLENKFRVSASASQEIDVGLYAFIERYATNLARWDVLLFFGQNPSAHGDSNEIAGQIGRRHHAIQKELDDLAYLGILETEQIDSATHYALARDLGTRRTAIRMAHTLIAKS